MRFTVMHNFTSSERKSPAHHLVTSPARERREGERAIQDRQAYHSYAIFFFRKNRAGLRKRVYLIFPHVMFNK